MGDIENCDSVHFESQLFCFLKEIDKNLEAINTLMPCNIFSLISNLKGSKAKIMNFEYTK
jgi:hypothetical protein